MGKFHKYNNSLRKYKNISGIYMLRSKQNPSLFYIGGTSNLWKRYLNHFSAIKTKQKPGYSKIKRSIKDLVNDEFIILKICLLDQLEFWEQYYISEYQPKLNSHRFVESNGPAAKSAFNDIKNEISNKRQLLRITDKQSFWYYEKLLNNNIYYYD